MPKQTTLFQSWGNKTSDLNKGESSRDVSQQPSTSKDTEDNFIDLCDSFEDDDDDILFEAEESLNLDATKTCSTKTSNEKTTTGKSLNLDRTQVCQTKTINERNKSINQKTRLFSKDNSTNEQTRGYQASKLFSRTEPEHHDTEIDDWSDIHDELEYNADETEADICNISLGADNLIPTQTQSTNGCPGFDKFAGRNWIYPTNYPVRDYQYNIAHQALYKNTMVTLPTGLGKTFIAAVVMFNFYRWYPQGKVVFMAPTKPLVAQQIEACYDIMGIPQSHMAEMTGNMGPPKREKAWREKRIFFLTPQVITNDLSRGTCPAVEVKCLVIDEAHKALGNHAYCQVVRELVKYSDFFRVLALSATPGSDIKAVQQVLNNLLISHIELRTEESIDIQPYSHERKVEKVVVPLGAELSKVKEQYIHVLEGIVRKLKGYGVLYNREVTSLSKFLILKAREAFRQNPPERLPRHQYGVVEGDFALAMSLYHGYELLQLHGSRSLYNYLEGLLSGEKGYGRTRTELQRNGNFNQLMEVLSKKYTVVQSESTPAPRVIGHPKMERLQEIVLEHFTRFQEENNATRVMIFSQFRDSVQEITDVLNVHKPLIKVMNFIGQSSAGKATKGFTQKEQLQVMKMFRDGGYNTLVSTCVGEEGLDIGDVDLIICFDAHKSPIRLVQRMGRTGRKREGRIVMLVTQGKEEQIYNQSQYSKRSIHKAILNGARSLHFYQHSPRMVPESITPSAHKMHITVKDTFKPTKKLSVAKSSKQAGPNTTAGASKKPEGEADLTLEEFRELEPWLVKEEIPKLPSVDLVCLPGGQQEEQGDVGRTFSLSDWTPWQTTLQETRLVDNGMRARHLVELMEFAEIQQTLEPGDDPYGLEMAAFLNKDDVTSDSDDRREASDRRETIDRFCIQLPKETVSETEKGKKSRMRVRPRDALPSFRNCEDKTDIDDSDSDLPDFDFRRAETRQVLKETIEKEMEVEEDECAGAMFVDKQCTVDGMCLVKMPPSVEEAAIVCKRLDEEIDSLKLNLVHLVKEWNKEHEQELCQVLSILGKESERFLEESDEESSQCDMNGSISDNVAVLQTDRTSNEIDQSLIDAKSDQKYPELDEISNRVDTIACISTETHDKDCHVSHDIDKEGNEEFIGSGKFDLGEVFCDSDPSFQNEVVDRGLKTQNDEKEKSSQVFTGACSQHRTSLFSDSWTIDDNDEELMKQAEIRAVSPDIETQMTFTQALACVHSGAKSVRKPFKSGVDRMTEISSNATVVDSGSRMTNPPPEQNDPTACSDEMELPQFDLGFDLDDDIIPPTPPAASQPSQLRMSQICAKSFIQTSENSAPKTDLQTTKMLATSETTDINDAIKHRNKSDVKCRRSLNWSKDNTVDNCESVHNSPKQNRDTDTGYKNPLCHNEQNDLISAVPKPLLESSSSQLFSPHDDWDFPLPTSSFDSSKQCIHSENKDECTEETAKVGRTEETARQDFALSDKTAQPCETKCASPALETSFCLFSDVFDDLSDSEVPVNCTKENDDRTKNIDKASESVDIARNITPDCESESDINNHGASSHIHVQSTNKIKSNCTVELHPPSTKQQEVSPTSTKQQEVSPTLLTITKKLSRLASNKNKVKSDDSLFLGDKISSQKMNKNLSSKTVSPKKGKRPVKSRKSEFLTDDLSFDSSFDIDLPEIKTPWQRSNKLMTKCSTTKISKEINGNLADTEHLLNFHLSINDICENADVEEIDVAEKECNEIVPEVIEEKDVVKASCSSVNDDSIIKVRRKKSTMLESSESESDHALNRSDCHLPFQSGTKNKPSQACDDIVDNASVKQVFKKRKTDANFLLSSSEESEFENVKNACGNSIKKIVQSVPRNLHEESDESEFESDILLFGKSVQIKSPPVNNKSFQGNEKDKTRSKKELGNKKPFTGKLLPSFDIGDDDDDFDDSFMLKKQSYVGKHTLVKDKKIENIKNRKLETKTSKHLKKKKRKRLAFIDEEAELSDHDGDGVSEDEDEDSELDTYEDSFIHDSQMGHSQTVEQSEMQALYLESVRSPPVAGVGYKLKYDYKHVDVFSQRPQPDDESQYQEDSFCVGSEEEESEQDSGSDEDEEIGEVTTFDSDEVILSRKRRRNLNLQTGRQREIHYGRKNALEQIKAKRNGKDSTIPKVQNDVGKSKAKSRVRINLQQDTSSDEEQPLNDSVSPKLLDTTKHVKKKRKRLLSSDEEEDDCFEAIKQPKRNTQSKPVIEEADDNATSDLANNESVSCREMPTNSTRNSDEYSSAQIDCEHDSNNITVKSGNANKLKEERLKLQKLKQEEFRKQLQSRSGAERNESSSLTKIKEKDIALNCTNATITKVQTIHESRTIKTSPDTTITDNQREVEDRLSKDSSHKSNGTKSGIIISAISTNSSSSRKLVVLVDTKEISGSQDVISDLRFKHKVHVSAVQMSGCDYILSNRMAVDRKQWSEFSNGSNRTKLIDRMLHLQELYDKPILIVEKDRVKTGEEKSSRPVHLTKYNERTLALLIRSQIKVYFTDSQAETASLLADMCKLEERKKMNITAKVDLNEEEMDRVKFYASIPKLSYVHALNLCAEFRSVSDLLKSSATVIERKGRMSANRAIGVFNYVRRMFDSSFLPTSHK